MKGIKATKAQKEKRETFRLAVTYAKWIYADETRKKAFMKTVKRRKHRAFQTAMKLYLHASPIRQLHLKLTMLKSCLSQSKKQREATKAKKHYFNLGPWKQFWPNKETLSNPKSTIYQLSSVNCTLSTIPLHSMQMEICPQFMAIKNCRKRSHNWF
jgi:hypothetical protein